jgi:hypothetical protein
MFTKSLAAGAVAFAVLAAATTTASAGYWGNGGNYGNYNGYPPPAYPGYPPSYPGIGRDYQGNNFYLYVRPRPYVPVQPAVQKVCKPVYKTVQVWKPAYGWVWATVYGGQQCWFQQVYPRQSYSYGW